jgi:hypothetical protein
MYFDPRPIRFGRLDATTDQAIYRVDLPDLRYDGWVRVSRAQHAAGGTEQWIADRLDDMAARNGYDVMCGRLYSPVDLADDVVGPRPLEGEWVCEQHPDKRCDARDLPRHDDRRHVLG